MVTYPGFSYSTLQARRQPDIAVPLFDPPYTISSGTLFKFEPGSLWPLFENSSNVSVGTPQQMKSGKWFTFGPFLSGVLTMNADSPGGGLAGFGLLYGDVFYQVPNVVGGNVDGYGWKAPLIQGGTFNQSNSPDVKVWSAQNINWVGPLGPKITAAKVNHITLKSEAYILDVGYGPFTGSYTYNLVINSILYPDDPIVSSKGYTGNATGGSQNWAPVNGVPDLHEDVTYLLFNPTGSQWYVGKWDFDFFFGGGFHSVNEVTFDDPAINTIFAGATTQATAFGFLMVGSGSPLFPGQASNIALVSPDFQKYALVKLLPQSYLSGLAIAGIGTPSVHLDPTGVFYMHDFASTTVRVFNSYSINIKWASVLLPANAIQPIALPALCGCMPYVPNTSKLAPA